jgi:hypothetical protein
VEVKVFLVFRVTGKILTFSFVILIWIPTFYFRSVNPRFSKICALVEERQKHWFIAINRSDLFQSAEKRENFVKFMFVCERHFVSGRPSKNIEEDSVDWLPSLNLGYDLTEKQIRRKKLGQLRTERKKGREERKVKSSFKEPKDPLKVFLEEDIKIEEEEESMAQEPAMDIKPTMKCK